MSDSWQRRKFSYVPGYNSAPVPTPEEEGVTFFKDTHPANAVQVGIGYSAGLGRLAVVSGDAQEDLFYVSVIDATTGVPVPAFSGDGRTTSVALADFASAHNALYDETDDKLYVVGTRLDSGIGESEATVLRYLPDGTLDPDWGAGGVAILPSDDVPRKGMNIATYDASSPHAGKVLVVAERTGDQTLSTIRFHSGGGLDVSYGVNGEAVTTGIVESGYRVGLAIDPNTDQAFVIAEADTVTDKGVYVYCYDADGEPDASFEPTGRIHVDAGNGYEMTPGGTAAIDNSGGLYFGVVIASPTPAAAVARVLPDGTLDPSFGSNSGFTVSLSDTGDPVYAVGLQSGGQVIAVASLANGLIIHRLGTDGVPDPAFGVGGYRLFDADGDGIASGPVGSVDIAILSDDSIAVAAISDDKPIVFKLQDDGDDETAFGTTH